MKKIIALFITLSLGFIINSSAIAENITIVGTGSGSSILQSIGDVFCRNNLGVSIIVPKSIGSGGGIKAVGTDQSVMGRVARNIKDSEQPYGLTYFPYSKNPIVFFLNKAAGIKIGRAHV